MSQMRYMKSIIFLTELTDFLCEFRNEIQTPGLRKKRVATYTKLSE